MHPRLRIYSYVLGGLFWTGLLLRVGSHPLSLHDVYRMGPLLAIAVAGEELVVRQRSDSDAGTLSFSAAAHVAAAILLRPSGAAITAALGVLIVDGLRRDGRHFVLINSAMLGGSSWAAAWVFHLTPGHSSHWGAALIPALLVLIVVRYIGTSTIFAGGLALTGAGSFFRVLGLATTEELAAAIGEGSLGVLVAFGVGVNPVLLPFLVPLFAALFASKANFERLRSETRRAIQAIVDLVDARDPTTAEHSERVAELVERFTDVLELPRRESERLVASARFHDLGKIAVESRTLASSERLTDEELARIRMHPRLSAQLLRPFSFAREMAEFAAHHHERWDGKGYYGVRGEEVPIEAHVLIVADSFDAMTSARPYRPALTNEEAVAELLDKAGTQFHPLVAPAFAAMIENAPVSTRVDPEELAALRDAFSTVRVAELPRTESLLQPRFAAMAVIVTTLVSAGILAVPRQVVVALSAGALLATGYWLATELRLRTRRRAAEEALEAGLGAEVVAAAAGFPGWVAWLADDVTGGHVEVPDRVPTADFVEVQAWTRLGGGDRTKRLASGTWAVMSEELNREHRFVLGLQRRPHAHERDLLTELVDLIAERQPLERRRDHLPETVEPDERTIVYVRLDAFERLRRGAGQLVAEQAVAEAERRLRAAIRRSDAVVRIGDDEFAISTLTDDEEGAAIRSRLRDTLAGIPVPHRLDRIAPIVVAARASEASSSEELARAEQQLFPGVSQEHV